MLILDIAKNELRRLYLSPVSWIIMAVVQFLLAVILFYALSQYLENTPANINRGITDIVIAVMLGDAGFLLLLITPFLTMRSFSDELRTGTINLLMSSPVSIFHMVMGKYLGLLFFFLVILLLITLSSLSLMLGTRLDLIQLTSGLIGLCLLMASFAAIGLFISTLTKHPAIAAIGSFAITFILWIIHIAGNIDNATLADIFVYLSVQRHYYNLLAGIFSSADLFYFLILITTSIALSIWRLDAIRTYQ